MEQYIYSVNSRRQVVHLSSCHYLKKIKEENLRSFEDSDSIRREGFRLCSCCISLEKRYETELKMIRKYEREHSLSVRYHKGQVHIISRYDSWILVENKKKVLSLYHRNLGKRNYRESTLIAGYHEQKGAGHKDWICEYLDYIVSHDGYRDSCGGYVSHKDQLFLSPKKKSVLSRDPIDISRHRNESIVWSDAVRFVM